MSETPRYAKRSLLRGHQQLVRALVDGPLADPRVVLFLGAGASVSSGIPTAAQLCNRWRRDAYASEHGLRRYDQGLEVQYEAWCKRQTPNVPSAYEQYRKAWEDEHGRQPSEYAFLFSVAHGDPALRQGKIEALVEGVEPGPGYIYLASLVASDVFRVVLTTNFDDLVHDALFRYVGIKPAVCSFDAQARLLNLRTKRPQILKLHGDFLFDNIKNVGSEVARLDTNMEQKFFQACDGAPLVVIGYSGGDQSVMSALTKLLQQEGGKRASVHWCLYAPHEKDKPEKALEPVNIPEEVYRLQKLFPQQVFLYAAFSFDEIMSDVVRGRRTPPPRELQYPRENSLYRRLRDGIVNADQRWRLEEEFHRLMKGFRDANLQSVPEVDKILDQCEETFREARAAADDKRFDEELRLLRLILAQTGPLVREDIRFDEDRTGRDGLTPAQFVWACRRESGVHGELADPSVCKESRDWDGPRFAQFGLDRTQAIMEAGKAIRLSWRGLETIQRYALQTSCRNHMINLAFNGLTVIGNLRELRVTDGEYARIALPFPPSELMSVADEWFRIIFDDELACDEYQKMIEKEAGGKVLLRELIDRAARAAGIPTAAKAEGASAQPDNADTKPPPSYTSDINVAPRGSAPPHPDMTSASRDGVPPTS